MEAIKLESNVGKCALRISATPKQLDEAGMTKFLGFLLWHDGASSVFAGGKKALFERNSEYSEALGNHAIAAVTKVMQPYFEGITIETAAEIKLSPEQKFIRDMVKIGLSEDAAKAGWAAAQAKLAEKPSSPEKEPETIE